jgi:hypothetical protein
MIAFMDYVNVLSRRLLLASTAVVAFSAGTFVASCAEAVQVITSVKPEYARILFDANMPMHMISHANGRELTITFDTPQNIPLEQMLGTLRPYVLTGRKASDRTVVLTMNEDYPIRSFASGSARGVDMLLHGKSPQPERVANQPKALSSPVAPNPLLSTKPKDATPITSTKPVEVAVMRDRKAVLSTKPIVETPVKKAELTPLPMPVAKPEIAALLPNKEPVPTSELPAATVENAIPATVKPLAAVMKVKEPSPERAITEVKPAEPSKVAVIPEVKKDNTVTPPPIKKAIDAAPVDLKEIREMATVKMPVMGDQERLVVAAQHTPISATFFFPFAKRTAAAVFQRGHDVFMVFSQPHAVNVEQLASVMPAFVTRIEQVPAENATVLRLVSDEGTLYNTAKLSGNGYEWVIQTSRRPYMPKHVSVPEVRTAPPIQPHVFVDMLQLAQEVTFTNPTTGELTHVIPSYEGEHGIYPERTLPTMTVLNTGQGIAYLSDDQEIRALRLREGVRLTRKGGLNVTPNLAALPEDMLTQAVAKSFTFYPYADWKIADNKDFYDRERALFAELSLVNSTKTAAVRLKLVKMYMAEGLYSEALGLLDLIQQDDPDLYRDNQLAALSGAVNYMMGRMDEAAQSFADATLAEEDEMRLWHRMMDILQGKRRNFDYLDYNRRYIRYYPPEMRRRIAVLAADNALALKKYSAVSKIFQTLADDGLLEPVQDYADYMKGRVYAENGNIKEAEVLLQPLIDNVDNHFLRARAAFTIATAKYRKGDIDRPALIAQLEPLLLLWRGDAFELNLLNLLGELYVNNQQPLEGLRAWRDVVTYFPNTTTAQEVVGRMSNVFVTLFSDGTAEKMTPLSALSLYYEFRDLTPLGREGDRMIQQLADRLAGVDLLARAASLLEHQVTFRLEKEERSRVGARLALIHLLNRQPEKTLQILELTGYGENDAQLVQHRNHLAAISYNKLGKWQRALNLLREDYGREAKYIRSDIYWENKDWENLARTVEDIIGTRAVSTDPLNEQETHALLRLTIAYSFMDEPEQLQYLRDYFTPLIQEGRSKEMFDFMTSGTAPITRETVVQLSGELNKMKGFLDNYKTSIDMQGLSAAF